MKISQNGINMIKRFESCRLKAYRDIIGTPTIGYGATGHGVHMGLVWTQEECDQRLESDLHEFERGIESLVTVELTQNQFDAILDFTYNCGLGNLQKSTLLKLINESDFEAASKQFLRWGRSGGKAIPQLMRRRQVESELFLTS